MWKKDTLKSMAFTNFGKRFFIYIQAVLQCHNCFPPSLKSSFGTDVQEMFESLFLPRWCRSDSVFSHVLKAEADEEDAAPALVRQGAPENQ